ncbi:MAG: GntR family transcriptional regulator [Chloroflexota bacterium]
MSELAPKLDPQSSQPLYAQIIEHIRSVISAGVLKPGDRLPAEQHMVRSLGVARITVRRAIAELVREGVLIRARAKGTFVAPPLPARTNQRLSSVLGPPRVKVPGDSVSTVRVDVLDAGARLAQVMGVPRGSELLQIQWLRQVEGEPAALETAYYPLSRFPGLDERDLDRCGIIRLIESRFGAAVAQSQHVMELALATNRESALLGVAPRAPLFLIWGMALAADGSVIERTRLLYRGDRFRFDL